MWNWGTRRVAGCPELEEEPYIGQIADPPVVIL